MRNEPFGHAATDFKVGDRVRFVEGASVSDKVRGRVGWVEGYDQSSGVHVVVTVVIGGKPIEQWVLPGEIRRMR